MSTTLWRPIGVYELRLIAQSGFRAFPPRLAEQPIFYPVCNQEYAAEIASKWNTGDPNSGHGGFVTRFDVADEVAAQYPRHVVGARRHEELWVPAADLASFCAAFVAPIAVVQGWLGPRFTEVAAWAGPVGDLHSDDLAQVIALIVSGPLRGGPRTEGITASSP